MPVITLNRTNSIAVDTYVAQANPTLASGSGASLAVGTGGAANQAYRTLIKFDFGLIPNNAVINSASLNLYIDAAIGGQNRNIGVHNVTSIWDGATTWNTLPTFNPTAGSIKLCGAAVGAVTFDIKQLAQDIINGVVPNNGFLLKDEDETALSTTFNFSSLDHGTVAQRPTLTIDYTIPTTGKKQVEYVGVGATSSTGSATSITPVIPAQAQIGDLMVAHLSFTGSNVTPITTPSGWTIQSTVVSSVTTHVLATKTHNGAESNPTFTTAVSSNAISGKIAAFRNVKSIRNKTGAAIENKTAFEPPVPPATVSKTMFAIFNSAHNGGFTFTPPLSYTEGYDVGTGHTAELIYKYMHDDIDQTASEMRATASAFATGASQLLILEPITNNPPTLTLTNPADNQTLSKGTDINFQWSASDPDGDPLTCTLQVGTSPGASNIYNMGFSGVSSKNGISTGWDLGTYYWRVVADDGKGGSVTSAERTFVISNNPPTISLTSPAENLLGAVGYCEDVSKFTSTGGTAALDNTRKTQGNNSIKVTKTAAVTNVEAQLSKYYPAVGDCFIVVADGFLDAAANFFYPATTANGLTSDEKRVTPSDGYNVTTLGQWIPVITGVKVTAVTTPGTGYFVPRMYHSGTIGDAFNFDNVRVFKITQAQYDALGTNVDLATAQSIAAQYREPVLIEGSTLLIEGTRTDLDSGNVAYVKYRIDNGTIWTLDADVSAGVAIPFSVSLTFAGKKLKDGSMYVTDADLAENTIHYLTVWSEDDKGGKSAEAIRAFTVIWNRPPTISGADADSGTIDTPPTFNYSVTDPEGQAFTVTEYLNGVQTKSFNGVSGQNYSITIDQDTWLRLALGVQHQVKVRATDSKGLYSDRVFTFRRTETHIEFKLKNPFPADAQPSRVLVTLNAVIPEGATKTIEACNNAFDAVPTWEDITSAVTAGRGYLFTNTEKTDANWGVDIRFTFDKGTATAPIIINGFGGAYD